MNSFDSSTDVFFHSSLVIELPGLTAHRTELLIDLRVEPFDDAVNVKDVRAVSPN
jgi:hypothetical protein